MLNELYSEWEVLNQLHKFKKLTQNMWKWGRGLSDGAAHCMQQNSELLKFPVSRPVLLKSQNHTAASPVMILLFQFLFFM